MEKTNKGWSLKVQEDFLKRMGELYSNGYSLLEALELMSIHFEADKKRNLLEAIQELQKGYSVHRVLEGLRFHQDILSLLFFSQKHGNLGQAFRTGGNMLERKRHYREKTISILKYPILLIFLVLIMLIFVQLILLPQFHLLFSQMNISLSPVISLFFNLVVRIPILVSIFVFCFLIAYIFFKVYEKRTSPSKRVSMLMRFPIVKTFLSLHYSHYFTQQLSTLLLSGLTINEAITVFEQQRYHPFFHVKAKEFRYRLVEGEKLEKLVESEKVFVSGLSIVIVHGQKNGKLGLELEQYSKLLLVKMQEFSEKLLRRIQPILFLGVGGFVFVLYLCIFIPMFQLLGGL
jgi:competence protein ComGB